MAFSLETKYARFMVCDHHCECVEDGHDHKDRCPTKLDPDNPGRKGSGCWEAHHHRIPEGDPEADELSNCRIYCWPCHEKTFDESS